MSLREPLSPECAMLSALLQEMQPPPVSGIAELSERDKARLLVTCCATLIVDIICSQAAGDRACALDGLQSLTNDMTNIIEKRLQNH